MQAASLRSAGIRNPQQHLACTHSALSSSGDELFDHDRPLEQEDAVRRMSDFGDFVPWRFFDAGQLSLPNVSSLPVVQKPAHERTWDGPPRCAANGVSDGRWPVRRSLAGERMGAVLDRRLPAGLYGLAIHEVTPMPDQMLSPKRIATEVFTDAGAAVARIAEIYERNVGFLRATFEAYVGGEPLDGRVRTTYPFVRITTGTHARLDSRLSYGFVSGPGIYESSVTRPDLFRGYFTGADRASHPEPWRAGGDRQIGRTDPASLCLSTGH